MSSATPVIETWRQSEAVEALARPHYREDLEYYNFSHALLAGVYAQALATQAIRHGADIDPDILHAGAAFHDAGIHLRPLINHPFAIPEEYAADVAARDMSLLSMPEPAIELMAESIESTNRFVPCATDTARCLRQADLMAGGVVAHPIVFINGTYRLYRDKTRINGEMPANLEQPERLTEELLAFGAVSHEVMSTYMEEDVALGPHQRDAAGNSLFNQRMAENVGLLEPANLEAMLAANLAYIVEYEPLSRDPRALAAA